MRKMKLTHLLAALGTVAGLAACSVGPDYVKPTTTAIPVAYKEMDGWKIASPNDNAIRGAWWELYNDPQLNALQEQVAAANQNVAQAEAQFRQARAQVGIARAGYFPTVGVSPAVTRSARRGATTADYSLPADLSWEADIWGRIRRSVESGRADAQANAADLAAILLSAQAELAQDYFQLRTLDAQKRLLDESVVVYQKTLELTRNRYAAGVAAKSDVLQAETQLKSTQAQAIDIGVQRAQLEHAIAVLIGKPASVFSIPPAPIAATPPSIPTGLPSELLERRPDIAAAERRTAAANAQIGVAEAAYYPTVKFSLSAGLDAGSLAKWFAWPARFWSLGPSTVAQTLFDGGLRRSQTAQARAAYDADVASYRQTVLTGFQEVEDALSSLRILEQEWAAQDEAVKAAQQSVKVATNQYTAGTVAYLSVLTAQTAELANERTALDIVGRRMTASVQLIKALGGGWNASSLPPDKELDGKVR